MSWPRSPGDVYLVICCFSTKNATHIVYLIVNKRACSLQVTNYYQVPEPRTALSRDLHSFCKSCRAKKTHRKRERRGEGEPSKSGLEFIRNHAASKSQRCLLKLSNCRRLAMFAQDLTETHREKETEKERDIAGKICWPGIGLEICVRACVCACKSASKSVNGCASMH